MPDELSFNSRRSPVYSRRGIVAASQPLAVAAGLEILSQGGNAADAAVATAAALNVTEPTSTALGGDCFALFYEYQWLFNGMALPNATNATLIFNNLSTNQTGDYAIVAVNPFGIRTSLVASLVVELPRLVASSEGFEIGWDGWTANNWIWEVGLPKSGPLSAHSGSNVMATVLSMAIIPKTLAVGQSAP